MSINSLSSIYIHPRTFEIDWANSVERGSTDMIVIHHTGNPTDDDLSAEELDESHRAMGWTNIGYHYVIRKDGSIEEGRPVCLKGAHAYGYNGRSIGIHLSGNFELAEPTANQIESAAMLIAALAAKYDLCINDRTVVGHRDLMSTACPGENLYMHMDDIRGKAIYYQEN
nr:MAG TPA: endodeoxyribonuclease I [Caudoviricetes sp.]